MLISPNVYINKKFKIIKIIKVVITNQEKKKLFILFFYTLITR